MPKAHQYQGIWFSNYFLKINTNYQDILISKPCFSSKEVFQRSLPQRPSFIRWFWIFQYLCFLYVPCLLAGSFPYTGITAVYSTLGARFPLCDASNHLSLIWNSQHHLPHQLPIYQFRYRFGQKLLKNANMIRSVFNVEKSLQSNSFSEFDIPCLLFEGSIVQLFRFKVLL